MSSKHNVRRCRHQYDDFERLKHIAPFVDAAIAPLDRYLDYWQARLVRSIVEAAIEVDPVSRRLLADVLRSRRHANTKASLANGEGNGNGAESNGPLRAVRVSKK